MSTCGAFQNDQDVGVIAREIGVSAGTYAKRPTCIVRGNGATLQDEQGKIYIDCVGGIGAALLGHGHPRLVAAIAEQAAEVISVPELFCSPLRASYQEALLSQIGPQYNRVFLCNSGTESVEAALKFAYVANPKSRRLALHRGYHGKSLGALSLTADPKHREKFLALLAETQHVNGQMVGAENVDFDSLSSFIFEAIQGEGGVIEPDGRVLSHLAERVQSHGGYVIADEVQCGFGRTGKMWGFQHHDVQPDFICMAKGIAGGVPMGAVAIHKRVPSLPVGCHTSTFGGNPLACRAGLAVLETIAHERLVERAKRLGSLFRETLAALRLPAIREIRGRGLMIGIELKRRAPEAVVALHDRGILVLLAGPRVIRLLPPLVITEEQISKVVVAIAEVLHDV